MKGIIDRFEGKIAVVESEDRKMVNIERSLLPPEAQVGDVIHEENGVIQVDAEETKRRKEEITKLTENLWE